MLDSKKLLYIFSDVAYVTELLPAKKQGDFALQNFRQINGEYLNNDVFITENIQKLFAKLDKEEYVLVLPDFFFTNTILEIGEKAKTKIDKQITEELFPSLGLTPKTHQLHHFVLTQYGEKSNVQLSAIERSLLAPIYDAATKNDIKISKVVSLSWTIKALISLEPSLSLVQMGENLYLVQHYIGVDQATSAEVIDVEKIAETVKTLRGAEPSIQTMYLLTNELVEKKIEELLNKTLPTQQLTNFSEENPEVPPYVRQIIEAGAKTLAVPEFNVPAFNIEKVDEDLLMAVEPLAKDDDEEEKEEIKKSTQTNDEDEINEPLPAPSAPSVVGAGVELVPVAQEDVERKINLAQLPEETDETEQPADDILENMQDDNLFPPKNVAEKAAAEVEKNEDSEKSDPSEALSRFAVKETDEKPIVNEPKTAEPIIGKNVKNDKPVIKNKTGVNSMLKMIFVSVAVFFLTVGIGVGLGISYLTVSEQNTPSPTPVATTTVSPSPVAEVVTPTASPAAELKVGELSVLVVNATSKAGYASSIKKMLTDADFVDVDTGNARGDYETGNYLLMAEENSQLLTLVEEATDLAFTYSSEIKTEDLKGSYDAVLVLNE